MGRVLVIDDSHSMTDLLWYYYTDEGFEVRIAEDGNEGIKLIEEFNPDLVVTDIIMPERNGIEVVMYLKFHHPETPVIAISSGGFIPAREHLTKIRELGADCILEKPFSRDEIISVTLTILSWIRTSNHTRFTVNKNITNE